MGALELKPGKSISQSPLKEYMRQHATCPLFAQFLLVLRAGKQ
jgi:hypothetical protein